MRLHLVGIFGLLLIAGCGGETRKGAYLDRCEVADDCEARLSCKLGRCTLHCSHLTAEAEAVCQELDAICAGTGCFPSCQGGSQCEKGLECYVTSQANVHACQPPEDEIPSGAKPAAGDFDNAAVDASVATDAAGSPPSVPDAAVPTTPFAAAACDAYQVRCRGWCFGQVGEQQDGCELVYLRERPLGRIRTAYIGEGAAFIEVETQTQGEVDVLRLDLNSGDLATVLPGIPGLNDARVFDGELYYLGYHEPWGDKGYHPLMKLSADGTLAPASGMLAQQQFADWNIFDDFIFMVAMQTDGTMSIYRAPLGAAPDAPFRPESEPGAEMIAQGIAAATMASDGTYLYYGSHHSGEGLGRVRIGDPESAELINQEFAYNFVNGFGLPKEDPESIYFALVGLQRVPRAGGPAEQVIDFPGTDVWVGETELLAWSERSQLHLVEFTPPSDTALDDDGDVLLSAWGGLSGYYVASKHGIVRIDR